MDPRQLFFDERLGGICGYCGTTPNTRDHVPSRVLLDEPYPANLPVIEACKACNEKFSQDEEYVACFIECAICGSAEPNYVKREKVRRILLERPLLAARIRESRTKDNNGNLIWAVDINRIENVVLKLARGHLAFELNIHHFEEPDILEIRPIVTMSDEELASFESVPENVFFPEIGSRAFVTMFKSPEIDWRNWHEVQTQRYRYRVDQGLDGDKVQFVLSEYLACKVIWT